MEASLQCERDDRDHYRDRLPCFVGHFWCFVSRRSNVLPNFVFISFLVLKITLNDTFFRFHLCRKLYKAQFNVSGSAFVAFVSIDERISNEWSLSFQF